MKPVLMALFFTQALASMAWATDLRVERAYDLIEQDNWDAAEQAATEALNDAKTDIDRFDAQEALATILYYTDDSPDILHDLHQLDTEAIRLFGRKHQRRVPVLELLGLTYGYLGDPEMAARHLTNLISIARLTNADNDILHFAMLNLATIYLDAGDTQTAAMLSADLATAAIEAYGTDDEVALEAALLRARAHLMMEHPIEAIIQAMPLILLGPENFTSDLPDLAERYSDFEAAIYEKAAQTGDAEQITNRWFAAAQDKLKQREQRDQADLALLEELANAIYADDIRSADGIARRLTATSLADDPFPPGLYQVIITSHVVAGDIASAVPWAKRLVDVSPEYLATTEFGLKDPLQDVITWLGQHGRFGEALDINAFLMRLTNLAEDPHAPALQTLRLERSGLLALSRRYDEARAETELALIDNSAYQPADPVLRASILSEFGQLAFEAKDFATAEARVSEAIALLQSMGRTNDLNWAEVLTSYGNSLTALGRGDEAIPLLQQALEVRQRITGVGSQSTVTGQIILAAAFADAERYDDATVLFDGALSAFREGADVDNPLLPTLMLAYAGLLDQAGESDAADQLFLEASLQTQQVENNQLPLKVLTLQQLAKRAWSLDALDEATKHLTTALEILPENDPALTEIQTLQGQIALENNDLAGALELFRVVTHRLDQPGQSTGPHVYDYLPSYIETLDRLARTDTGQADALLDETFLVAQNVNALSAGSALSQAAARWSATPKLSSTLRKLQDTDTSGLNV